MSEQPKKGLLTIGRLHGQAVYIGRDVTVTVSGIEWNSKAVPSVLLAVHAPVSTVVSAGSLEHHLESCDREENQRSPTLVARFALRPREVQQERSTSMVTVRPGDTVFIGRSVGVKLYEVQIDRTAGLTPFEQRDHGNVKLSIRAPRWIAISRDDFPWDTHVRFCEMREQGENHLNRQGG